MISSMATELNSNRRPGCKVPTWEAGMPLIGITGAMQMVFQDACLCKAGGRKLEPCTELRALGDRSPAAVLSCR